MRAFSTAKAIASACTAWGEAMSYGSGKSELTVIPGIGPSLAADLEGLGVRAVADLRRANPEALYDELCAKTGVRQDRCVLYAFRCAVYYASHASHDPNLLKWWNWKDRF